jgi:predicted TIM-barrel fold metal-dependent hydrolase
MRQRDDLIGHATARRQLLKQAFSVGAASAGAVASGLPSLSQAATSPSGNFRIDVHCHHIPEFYRHSLWAHGIFTAGGIPLPSWSPSAAVDFMDRYGIQVQVVSISEPGVTYLPTPAERLSMARQLNDYTRDTLVQTSDATLANRFGGFAVMPLGDPKNPVDIFNASAEAERALTSLQLDGIGLFSSYGGIYLGDPCFEPLMATLNTLGAMVFIHPVTPKAPPDLGLPSFLFEFPFDTTRAAVNLLYKGVFSRYPRIRWLLAHAGGTVPYLSYRSALLKLHFDPTTSVYKDLYYDTALSSAPPSMAAVRQITDVSHVMFATDWPFSSLDYLTKPAGDPATELNLSFNTGERLMVDRRNALAQFPTLAARLGVTV